MKKNLILVSITALVFCLEFYQKNKNRAFGNLNILNLSGTVSLKIQNDNPITTDADKKQFALYSFENEFYITDENLNKLKYRKHDKYFTLEFRKIVSARWYKDLYKTISCNKSFIRYESNENFSKKEQNDKKRHLLAGWNKFKINEDDKGSFLTLLAKQKYILTWKYDSNSNKFIIVSTPNDICSDRTAVIFDSADKMIVKEYAFAVNENLNSKENKDVLKYYIVGMDARSKYAHFLNKNYSTNLKRKEIERGVWV